MCDHHGQERVRGDVERYAKEDIGAALVELAAEFSVGHVELEERMARRESHLINNARVISHDQEAAAVGVVFDLLNDIGELVDCLTVCCAPASPLFAVNRA